MTPNEQTTVQVFDRSQPMRIWYVDPSGNEASRMVRYPSDEQLVAYRKKQRTVFYEDGSSRQFGVVEANCDLLSKISIDSEPADEETALAVIPNGLLQCDADKKPERNGGEFIIELVVTGGLKVTHVLRRPKRTQVADFFQNWVVRGSNRYGEREADRYDYPRHGKFFKDLFVEASGYADPSLEAIPVEHKSTSVVQLVGFLGHEEQELRARQNFS